MKILSILFISIFITACATKKDIKKEINFSVIPKINDLNVTNIKEHKNINTNISINRKHILQLNRKALSNANARYKLKIKQLEFNIKIDAIIVSQELMKYNFINYVLSSKSKTLKEDKKLQIWKKNLKINIEKKLASYDKSLSVIRKEIYYLDNKAIETKK
jgi:hypothetical protein